MVAKVIADTFVASGGTPNNITLDTAGNVTIGAAINNGTWTTGTRPTPVAGMQGYNSTTGNLEFYNGLTSSWTAAGGGSSSSITVGTTTITGGTSGAIAFNNANTYGEDATQLFWDNTNNRLGIGTNTPTVGLQLAGSDALINGLTVGRGGGAIATNTVVGSGAQAATGGANNVAVGTNALAANTAAGNTAVGSGALGNNTTGTPNTAVGYQALNSNQTGTDNVAVGDSALAANTTGAANTAVGSGSLVSNTTGAGNTSVGQSNLVANDIGSYNTAVGQYSMSALAGSAANQGNTAVGNTTMVSLVTGRANTSIGWSTLASLASGNQNTAIGDYSLHNLTGGNYNTGIGASSGSAITTGSYNVILGTYDGSAAPISGTGSNYIVLSDGQGNARGVFDPNGNFLVGTTTAISGAPSAQTGVTLYGGATDPAGAIVCSRNGPTSTDAVLFVNQVKTGSSQFVTFNSGGVGGVGSISYNGANTLYNATSDRRLKENIADFTDSGSVIDALKPRSFTWKSSGIEDVGFIADEIQQVIPKAVTGEKDAVDAEGNPVYQQLSVSTPELIATLVAEVKSLRARVAELEAKN